jgi:hypothetical protein
MGSDGADEQGLEFDVAEDERPGHGCAGGEAGFAIEVTG